MRKLFLILLLSKAVLSDEEELPATIEPDYAKPLPERQLWKQVRENFLKHTYPRILKQQKLALSCDGCSAIYMDISFSLDSAGVVSIKAIDRTKACGGEFSPVMREEFAHFVRIYPYPTALRGTSVRLRLGTGLSC